MQVAQVKTATKSNLPGKAHLSEVSQKADKAKAQESNVIDLQKQANHKRMFEAYNDCV